MSGLVVPLLLLCGCATPEMKGTPFYSGEYAERKGPVEDRVNLWPLVDYRDPALSVLWPFVEKTDDHFALRPLLSVYGLAADKRVYNVLWPIAQFDTQSGEHRVFPIFWGEDYVDVFPFYWHHGHPLGGAEGYDGLLPLWSFYKDRHGYSLYCPWPLVHLKDRAGEAGWHVWPLAGHYASQRDSYTFWLWPLGHKWAVPNVAERGDTFLPFYYRTRDARGSLFVSLPWSHGLRADGTGWQVMPPLFFHARGATNSTFLSLPWSQGRRADGTAWQCIPLLLYHSELGDNSRTITPLYAGGASEDGARRWHALIPLYYVSRSDDERVVATLLGGFRSDARGRGWLIYPLLSWGARTEEGGSFWALAPLIHARWDRQSASHHVLPLYYWNGHDRTFLSLLAAQWHGRNDRMTTMAPLALSWLTTDEKRKDLWLLGGLGHASWGAEPGPHHLVPFYYRNRKTGTFISPVVATWDDLGAKHWVWPLLLSCYTHDGDEKDLWTLAGLVHQRWGHPADTAGHVLPFYIYKRDAFFLTPLFGWNKDPEHGYVYPLTPLVGVRTGDFAGGWLFPLFSRERDRRTQERRGTVLWGHYRRSATARESGFFPLYSYRRRGSLDPTGEAGPSCCEYNREFFCLPICWRRDSLAARPDPRGSSNDGPPPLVLERVKQHGVFPLWKYSRTSIPARSESDVQGSVLLGAYDYKRRVEPAPAPSAATNDYTRARVLWRLWHYERAHGDVSVDVFPAITYDRKQDGFKKFSFLWRLIRYERRREGTELDLFFIPFRRCKAAGEPVGRSNTDESGGQQ